MRLANLHDRLTLVFDGGGVDVEVASSGRFGADPQAVYDTWDEFRSWAKAVVPADLTPTDLTPVDQTALGAPVPRPRQVFAVGVNYAAHAREAGYPVESVPIVFTKFVSSLCGPNVTVALPSGCVDWEVELVVVVGRRTHHVAPAAAWDHVAGLTIGQDLSDREVQMQGAKPQFSLGKSFPQFGPTGPWLVTPDELGDPDDLWIRSIVNDTVVQESRTSHMIDDVPSLLAKLSAVCPLLPGDIIFTGTPEGVGNARTPKWFLGAGDVLISEVEGLGRMTTNFAAAPSTDGARAFRTGAVGT